MKHINIGIVAHVDAGKTTLTEALLYKTGSIRHLGRVDARDTFLDTNEQERERGITIFSKQARLKIGSLDITLVDTPGHVDFSAEAESVLQVLDYCILIISAADGIKGHTLTLWSLLEEYDIPTFIFVNKMDQPGASADAVMAELKDRLSDACLDLSHAYVGTDARVDGYESGEAHLSGAETGIKLKDLFAYADEDYENIAMCDEGLMEEYLESMEPIDDERIAGLIRERKLFPVFFGSALKLEGVDGLMAGLSSYTKEDEYAPDFAARVFKITRDPSGNRLTHLKILGGTLNNKDLVGDEKVQQIRIYSGNKFEAVTSAGAGMIAAVTGLNNTRMGMGLGTLRGTNLPLMEPVLNYKVSADDGTDTAVLLRNLRILEEEDPQLIISYEEDVKEIRISVMGEVQLEVLKRTVWDRFHESICFDTGTVVYKETVAEAVEGVGHYEPLRHYAEVHLWLEPLPPGSGMVFGSDVSTDDLALNWQRLILTHLNEKIHRGVLTGAPLTDMRITLIAGRAHLKHTEGGDFRQATYRAVRQGLMKARSVLLEPYLSLEVTVPQDCLGRVMNDLSLMGGSPGSPEDAEDGFSRVRATVPASACRNYARDLSAQTKGLGRMSAAFAAYLPCADAEKVIAEKAYDPLRDLANSPDSVFCSHGAGVTVPWDQVEQYMHLPLREERKQSPEPAFRIPSAARAPSADEEETLRLIFEKTYGPAKTRQLMAPVPKEAPAEQPAGEKKEPSPDGEILLVDGYNVLYAWEEWAGLLRDSFEAARMQLTELLCDYAAVTGREVILVFDAYKVRGNPGSAQKYKNIYVVYTREAQTADAYIEKTTLLARNRARIRVVTSDRPEQLIALGNEALRTSAREFRREVTAVEGSIAEFLSKNYRPGTERSLERLYKDAWKKAHDPV